MADKLMNIPNDDSQNYPFCILQLVIETIGHWTLWTNQSKFNKSQQLLSKHCYKNLKTSLINSPMSQKEGQFITPVPKVLQ